MKKSSPFLPYFEEILSTTTHHESRVKNIFYAPIAFKSIIQDKLHLVSLWSGIILKKSQFEFTYEESIDDQSPFFERTRLTNQIAENYHKTLKNNILQINKNNSQLKFKVSSISKPIWRDLNAKFVEKGYNLFYEKLKASMIKIKEMNITTVHDFKEMWKKGVPHKRMVKSHYYNHKASIIKTNSFFYKLNGEHFINKKTEN